MKINKKLIKILSTIFGCCTLTMTSSLLTTVSHNTNVSQYNSNSTSTTNNNQQRIEFNGKYYNNLEDATNDYLYTNKSIKDEFVIGDLQNSIIDIETNRINYLKLKPYDVSKLKKAYKTANGKYTQDYLTAKKSYVNNGLIKQGYDDFNGNIFSTIEEASQSIRNHTTKIGTPYYELQDSTNGGKLVKINPLNATDIDKVKEIAINDVLNPTTTNQFKLNIRLKNKDNNFQYINDSASSGNSYDSLYGKNSVTKLRDTFAKNMLDNIKNKVNDFLASDKNTKKEYEVNVKVEHRTYGSAWGTERARYIFDINGKRQEVMNLKFNLSDIMKVKFYLDGKKGYTDSKKMRNTLLAFLDADTLNYSSVNGLDKTIRVKQHTIFLVPNDLAEEAINVKVGNNPIFSSLYVGSDEGGTGGIDFRLLNHGSEDLNKQYNLGDIRYNLDFTFNPNFWNTLINDLKNYLCDLNMIKSVFVESFPQEYNGIDPNSFFDNIVNVNDYKNFIDKLLENNRDLFTFMNLKKSVDGKPNRANGFDINEKYTDIGNRWNTRHDAIYEELERQRNRLKDALRHLDLDVSRMTKNDKLNEFFNLTFGYDFGKQEVDAKKMELTIDYNNQPIFSLTDDFIKLVNVSQNNSSDKSYLRQRIIKHLDKNRDKNYLINVSNKFSNLNGLYVNKNSNSNLISIDATNKSTIDEFINGYKELINFYTIENFKDELINKTSLLIDSQNPLSSNLGIILALYSYHKRIIDPNFNNSQASKNLLKDSSNILVLKKDNGSLLDIKYGEIVGTSTSINEPLSNDKKNKISINQQELNQYIALHTSLTPAKVVVIYDLDNNIVNSDFSIDGNGYGDGSYDSEQTIIDNALNTLIFNQDAEYVYYVDNNQETLVKNSVNQIYSLSLNDKIYYYPTFKDARNELKEYINLNAKHFN
ncbi:hypothetical protein [Malacoplasma muris]|uniref:hypothetical protein n=1 Tax=Malacoplasma muris TaxID=2119 RepID=UPI00398F39D3